MTCQEFQSSLADELAGELALRDSLAMRAHAAACESCAWELRSLEDVQGRIRAGVVSPEAADAAACAAVARAPHRLDSSPLRVPMLLRYAAMIAAGFLAGYSLQGTPGNMTVAGRSRSGDVAVVSAEPVHQSIVSRYRAAEAAYPGASAFSRTLVAVARP